MPSTSTRVWLRRCRGLEGDPRTFPTADIDAIERTLAEMFDAFPEIAARVPNARVLLKPNLVRPNAAVPAMTTDIRVIAAIVRVCRRLGAREIAIGEKPGYGFPARKAFCEAGFHDLAELGDVPLHCFDEQPWQRVHNPGATLFLDPLMPQAALDCDLLINVPKMKTHMHTLVSLGMKNFQGLVADDERMLFHRCDLNHKIVDTILARTPDFTIIDGLWPMEGQAPFYGQEIPGFNVLVAGDNVAAVDVVACRVMGIAPGEVAHLRIAAEKGLIPREDEAEDLTIIGDRIDGTMRPFMRPVVSSSGAFRNITAIEAGVCLGCLSAIRHSLDKLKFEGRIDTLPHLTIISGRSMPNHQFCHSWKGDLWLFGNCAVEIVFPGLQDRLKPSFIQGCPPHVLDLHREIVRTYGT